MYEVSVNGSFSRAVLETEITKVTYPRACMEVAGGAGISTWGEHSPWAQGPGFTARHHHFHGLWDLIHKALSVSEPLFPHWENEVRMTLPPSWPTERNLQDELCRLPSFCSAWLAHTGVRWEIGMVVVTLDGETREPAALVGWLQP